MSILDMSMAKESEEDHKEVVGHGQGRLHAAWTTSAWSCGVGTGSITTDGQQP